MIQQLTEIGNISELLESGWTLRQIEDELDWLENQACENGPQCTQTAADDGLVTEEPSNALES